MHAAQQSMLHCSMLHSDSSKETARNIQLLPTVEYTGAGAGGSTCWSAEQCVDISSSSQAGRQTEIECVCW